jgi:hypothetical protein
VTQRRKGTPFSEPLTKLTEKVELPQEALEETKTPFEEEPLIKKTPELKLEPKPMYVRPTTPVPPRETSKHPRNTLRYTR